LQGRYLLAATIYIIIIIAGTWWSSYGAHNVHNNSISNILLKNQTQKITRRVRLLLWEVNHSLQSYMVAPKTILQEKIHRSIKQSLQQVSHLKKIKLPEKYYWLDSIEVLNKRVSDLSNLMDELIIIRNDPEKLHPAMTTMNNIMLPASNDFSTAATLALEEIEFDNLVENRTVLKLFDRAGDNWNKMIGTFRVFIANRFGAFSISEEGIKKQGENVEILYNVIHQDLKLLHKISLTSPLDLQGQESLEVMITSAKAWFKAYLTVRKSYLSDKWRTDVPFLHTKIQPTLISIWNTLDDIDLVIDLFSDDNIAKMGGIAGHISNILWIFFVIALALTIAGYIFFQSVILSPIKKLSTALFNEANGSESNNLEKVTLIGEIKELHQAFILMQEKVQERQTELQSRALHDPLTGLPNRILMEDRLHQALSASERGDNSSAVLVIDLNKFKDINDTMGHYAGDLLLQETSKRLTSVLRTTGTVARIGGDEFAIIIPGVNEFDIKLIVKRILEAFKIPYILDSNKIIIEMSIGVSIYPKDGEDAVQLLKNADSAMYQAKRKGEPVRDTSLVPVLHNYAYNIYYVKSYDFYIFPSILFYIYL